MKQFAAIVLFSTLIAFGVWFAVYEAEPSAVTRDCLKSHTAFRPVMIGKVPSQQPYRVCDEYGPWYPNPRHARWCASHSDQCRE